MNQACDGARGSSAVPVLPATATLAAPRPPVPEVTTSRMKRPRVAAVSAEAESCAGDVQRREVGGSEVQHPGWGGIDSLQWTYADIGEATADNPRPTGGGLQRRIRRGVLDRKSTRLN